MPYTRVGAAKISEHHIQSPLLMINRSCQVCHPTSEDELRSRVYAIQDRTHALMSRAGQSLDEMLDEIVTVKKAGATEAQLAPIYELQRKGAWRLDFVNAENSMGFHADQETARTLGESIDFFRQAQLAAQKLRYEQATTRPSTPTAQAN
jgi:nitrite reductase (cytochrome c-552)